MPITLLRPSVLRPPALAFMLGLCCALPVQAASDGASEIHQLLHQHIEQQVRQHGLNGEPVAQFDTDRLSGLSPCTQAETFVAGPGPLRSRFSIGLRCLAPSHWVTYVPVRLRVMGTYPVAARPLAPHTLLTRNELAIREGDLLRLPAGAATTPEDVIGHTTVQRIAANQVFKYNTLQAPHAILRGQTVTLEVRGEGFTVTGEGTAMQSGEPGSLIQVRTASGQVTHGRVLNAQTVLLSM